MPTTNLDRTARDLEYAYDKLITQLRTLWDLALDPADNAAIDAAWQAWPDYSWKDFAAQAKRLGADVHRCDACDVAIATSRGTVVDGGSERVCEDCRLAHYTLCGRCETWTSDDEMRSVNEGGSVCSGCCDRYYTWCEDCGEYFPDADMHGHDDDWCRCDAPRQSFVFPAPDGYLIDEDELFELELPKGTIDQVGLDWIAQLLHSRMTPVDAVWFPVDARNLIHEVGPEWQGKRGNFTRRLSSAYYRKYGGKLDPELVSQIGNLARQHSSSSAGWRIELTRDFNLGAGEFYNAESCWWGCENASLCALKHWGGIGLRSYCYPSSPLAVSGRAWVQPLTEGLEPTHDAVGAHAFVVYNGYGDLEGYAPARLVAHLTGRTYKRVSLSCTPQWVNSGAGYLVADAATCAATDEVRYSFGIHDNLDARTFDRMGAAA